MPATRFVQLLRTMLDAHGASGFKQGLVPILGDIKPFWLTVETTHGGGSALEAWASRECPVALHEPLSGHSPRKVVGSAKRLRRYIGIDEASVCAKCSKSNEIPKIRQLKSKKQNVVTPSGLVRVLEKE